MSTKDNYALNSFIILEQNGNNISDLDRVVELRLALVKRMGLNKVTLPRFRAVPRKIKPFHVDTEVTFIQSKRQDRSMMELITLDTPGLLARIGEIFYRCDILLVGAKITTIGERAEDFFVLQTREGAPLNEQQKLDLTQVLVSSLTKTI